MDFLLSDDDILNQDSSDDELSSLTPPHRGIVRPLPPSAERMNRQQLNRFQGMSWYDNHDGTIEIQSNTGGVVTTWTRRRFQPNWITQRIAKDKNSLEYRHDKFLHSGDITRVISPITTTTIKSSVYRLE